MHGAERREQGHRVEVGVVAPRAPVQARSEGGQPSWVPSHHARSTSPTATPGPVHRPDRAARTRCCTPSGCAITTTPRPATEPAKRDHPGPGGRTGWSPAPWPGRRRDDRPRTASAAARTARHRDQCAADRSGECRDRRTPRRARRRRSDAEDRLLGLLGPLGSEPTRPSRRRPEQAAAATAIDDAALGPSPHRRHRPSVAPVGMTARSVLILCTTAGAAGSLWTAPASAADRADRRP